MTSPPYVTQRLLFLLPLMVCISLKLTTFHPPGSRNHTVTTLWQGSPLKVILKGGSQQGLMSHSHLMLMKHFRMGGRCLLCAKHYGSH